MVNKFGIYLQYSRKESIRGHGIGRTNAFLINGLLEDKFASVVIAAPSWFKKDIDDLLKDNLVDAGRVEFIIPRKSTLLKIADFISRKIKPRHIQRTAANKPAKKPKNFVWKQKLSLLLAKDSYLSILPFCFFSLLSLLLSPLIILIYWSRVIVTRLYKHNKDKLHLLMKRLIFPIKKIARLVFNFVLEGEVYKLISMVNARQDIKAWYIPTIFWPQAKSIKATKIFAIPDLVYLDYPVHYASSHFLEVNQNVHRLLDENCRIICYCDYVKENHVVNKLPIRRALVSVIKHGAMNQMSYLTNSNDMPTFEYRLNALRILTNYCQSQNLEHYKNFDFTETKFIFYSSQIRFHKNYLSLIKAYEILLRERFSNIKLIVTGNIYHPSDDECREVRDYIFDKKLNYDVLSFYNIPSQVLAALNALALCAVNPTLFEGGFPFTFTEAYSVGTPSVMSAIPMVIDEIDDLALRKRMLFDPYYIDDMVAKIEWAIQHREELYELEKPLYEKFQARSWQHVARDYLTVFNDASKK